jgi:hypothetical protein
MKLNPKFKAARRARRHLKPALAVTPTPAAASLERYGFGRLWNPALVDRLRAPLTRFRD